MIQILHSSWALLLGMMLLMVGNGVQGTLLGIRGSIEGFSTFELSLIMSGYFAGFLGGSRLAPLMIRRVGHVRVFAALGSFISAVLIMYPALTDPWIWMILRVAIGFCFSGVYVTAESWLNNAASNENRGKALSLYMIVQMVGIVAAQGLLVLGDPSGFVLFVIPSVLVSIAFAPILLSVSPTPSFETAKGMDLVELFRFSPLGCVGLFLLGGVFSALFGMAAIYGTAIGLSIGEISSFISMIYIGGLVMQFPIGWMSDRMDRRILILIIAGLGALASLIPILMPNAYLPLLLAAFFLGGMSNPLYALLIAYVNDFLDPDDMPAASSGLIFINGVGAIAGPIITGWAMTQLGPSGFFAFITVLLLALVGYGGWRLTQRAALDLDEQGAFVPVSPSASPVAVDMAQEVYIEAALDDDAT